MSLLIRYFPTICFQTTTRISIFASSMIPYNRQYILITMAVLLTGLLLSCSSERKFATAFVDKSVKRSVLVFYPDFLFKTNQKTFLLDSLGVTDEAQFDTVLMANSKYLQFVDDSLFLANYVLGFTKELTAFGFDVFAETRIEEFMEVDTNAFVINTAQIELEETIYTHTDESIIYDTYYSHDQDLEAVYVNSWIEISQVNDNSNNPNVYFATGLVTDDFEGDFSYDIFTGKISYIYNIDSLKQADLYRYAYQLGRTFAGYTFDFLLNTYLDKTVPKEERSGNYWRFNPYDKTFFPAYDDRLVPLDD
jgi:hypothetical protein